MSFRTSRFQAIACVAALTLATTGALAASAPAEEGSFDRTLKVNGPVELHVATGSGTIKVNKGSSSEVHIFAKIKASDDWRSFWTTGAGDQIKEIERNPPIQQEGNRITIGERVHKWEHISISYEISVPQETRLSAGSGSGTVEAFDVRGPAELSTGSGTINAERIGAEVRAQTGSGGITVSRAGGTVHASTGSGSIQTNEVTGDVDASTGSGNITVSHATGKIRAHAGSGHVRVEQAVADLDVHSASGGLEVEGAPKSAHWDLETASGSVRVMLPHNTGFELDAHAGSGSVSTSHPVSVSGTMRHGELRGVSGSADNHLRIRTASGSIRIE
jgi:DUF4097 and DUF4098 domain-containing protein YvlB